MLPKYLKQTYRAHKINMGKKKICFSSYTFRKFKAIVRDFIQLQWGFLNFIKRKKFSPPPKKVNSPVATFYAQPVVKHTFGNCVSSLYHPCIFPVSSLYQQYWDNECRPKCPHRTSGAGGGRGSAPPPKKKLGNVNICCGFGGLDSFRLKGGSILGPCVCNLVGK